MSRTFLSRAHCPLEGKDLHTLANHTPCHPDMSNINWHVDCVIFKDWICPENLLGFIAAEIILVLPTPVFSPRGQE
jgi:hypothetical protein